MRQESSQDRNNIAEPLHPIWCASHPNSISYFLQLTVTTGSVPWVGVPLRVLPVRVHVRMRVSRPPESPSCSALETPTRLRGSYGQRSHSSIRKTHKSAVIGDLTVPEKSRQHRESLICERLIDERLLPLKRFNGT